MQYAKLTDLKEKLCNLLSDESEMGNGQFISIQIKSTPFRLQTINNVFLKLPYHTKRIYISHETFLELKHTLNFCTLIHKGVSLAKHSIIVQVRYLYYAY